MRAPADAIDLSGVTPCSDAIEPSEISPEAERSTSGRNLEPDPADPASQRFGPSQPPNTTPTHAPATSRHAKSSARTLDPPERIAVRVAAFAASGRPRRSRSER